MSIATDVPPSATPAQPGPRLGPQPGLGARADSAFGRLLMRPWFWLGAVVLLGVVPMVRLFTLAPPKMPPDLGVVPSFQLTDEAGHPFGTRELAGKVVVVDFIFTRCGSICPRLTQEMSRIQYRLRNAIESVHLVSISVDPEYDTPARLEAYARSYHADEHVWSFLTGPAAAVQDAVVKGFKEDMERQPAPGAPAGADNYTILHSGHLVLLDQRGHIRGYYDANKPDVDRMMGDVELLADSAAAATVD